MLRREMEHFEYPQLDKFQNSAQIQPIEDFFEMENELISPSAALYIHIPFCSRFCLFCNFYKVPLRDMETVRQYVNCLKSEVEYYAKTLPENYKNIEGVHLGGGSPSVIPVELLKGLIETIKERLNLVPDCLISMECHIDNLVNADYVKGLREIGVNRLSFGVQSFDEAIRKRYLLTNVKNVYKAIENVKASGIKNYNADLMYNFPSQRPEDVCRDFEELFELGCNCVELNAMNVVPNSNMYNKLREDDTLMEYNSKIDEFVKMYEYISERPEISLVMANAISKTPQKPNVCNSFQLGGNKVNGGAIIGLGASGRGFVDGYVYKNAVDINDYMKKISEGGNAIFTQRTISTLERYARLMVMFPMFRSVMKEDVDLEYVKKETLDKLVAEKLINEDDEKYYLSVVNSFYSGNISANFFTNAQKDRMMMYVFNSMRNNLNMYNQDRMQMDKQ
jgi:oxygen-independent coproporphyrinogen-3 oxidase